MFLNVDVGNLLLVGQEENLRKGLVVAEPLLIKLFWQPKIFAIFAAN